MSESRTRPTGKRRTTKATLIKLVTDDGLMGVESGVPVGRRYTVDLATVRIGRFFNAIEQRYHTKRVVDVRNRVGGDWGAFPTDLLQLDGGREWREVKIPEPPRRQTES